MTRYLQKSNEIAARPEKVHTHQFNANAVRMTRTLSEHAGLARIGIHLVRLTPGRESTQAHWHDADEEFIYILEGRGIAEIGDESCEVGPGDFMGFPTPSPAHTLRNPFDEDLVYLVGGERNRHDVVHYPRIRRSMIKGDGRRRWVDWDHLHDVER
jgi:uncharacterized cupin superfamily protein